MNKKGNKYIRLLRIKHYIKNFLIFLPLFFGKEIFKPSSIKNACLGFLSFSLLSSAVYIINDIRDIDNDRNHPGKKERPIASGEVSLKEAKVLIIILIILSILFSFILGNLYAFLITLLYLFLNILYSFGLKNIPLLDVIILSSGFLLRVFYGGVITNIEISHSLYLVIISGSLFLSLSKRRNELRKNSDTGREVLKYYSESFLDKNMYVFYALTDVFYALWAMSNKGFVFSVPFFIVILMYYSFIIEGDSDGDPVEVITKNKGILILGFLYIIIMFLMLYFF